MIYDFKSENNEQEIVLFDIEELVEDILDEYLKLKRYEFLSVYSNYEEIIMLILKLYKDDALDFLSQFSDYSPDKMMILTISYDGILTVQEMINDITGTAYYSEAILTYVYNAACSVNVLKTLRLNDENILNYSYKKDFD